MHIVVDCRTFDDPRTRELCRILDDPHAWRHLVLLWRWQVERCKEDGVVDVPLSRLAVIGEYQGEPRAFVAALKRSGWLNQSPAGVVLAGVEQNRRYFAEKKRLKNRRLTSVHACSTRAARVQSAAKTNRSKPKREQLALLAPEVLSTTGSRIDAVMGRYLQHFPRRYRATREQKARKLVADRLQQYTVDELCQAIDGCMASPFHVRGGYTALTLIFRDTTKTEYFLEIARNGPAPETPTEKMLALVREIPRPEGEPEWSLWGSMEQDAEKAHRRR